MIIPQRVLQSAYDLLASAKDQTLFEKDLCYALVRHHCQIAISPHIVLRGVASVITMAYAGGWYRANRTRS